MKLITRNCIIWVFFLSACYESWCDDATQNDHTFSSTNAEGAAVEYFGDSTITNFRETETEVTWPHRGIPTVLSIPEDAAFPGTDAALANITVNSILINESTRNPNQKSCDQWEWNTIRWGIANCVQVIIAIFGITGNLLVILVLAKRRQALRSMDIFIGGLAIADFVSSLFLIPLPTSKLLPNTPFGLFYCKMVDSLYFLFHSLCTSSYILLAMGVERYMAVAYPIRHMLIFSPRRSKIVILLVWLASVLSVLFIPFVFVLTPQCTCLYYALPSVVLPVGIFNYFTSVILPVSTLILTQALTAYSLHKQRLMISNKVQTLKDAKPTFHSVARNRVIELMFVVVSTYVICFTPNQTAYLLVNLGVLPISFVWSPLSYGLVNLMFLNSCANPIIYTMRYPPFRKAVKELFCGTSASFENTPLFGHKSESVNSKYAPTSDATVDTKI